MKKKSNFIMLITMAIVLWSVSNLWVNASYNHLEQDRSNIIKEKEELFEDKYGITYEQLFEKQYVSSLVNKCDIELYENISQDINSTFDNYCKDDISLLAFIRYLDPSNIKEDITLGDRNLYEKYTENVLDDLLIEVFSDSSNNYHAITLALNKASDFQKQVISADEKYLDMVQEKIKNIYYDVLTEEELESVLALYKQENYKGADELTELSNDALEEIVEIYTLMTIDKETINWLISKLPYDSTLKSALQKRKADRENYYRNNVQEFLNDVIKDQLWSSFQEIIKLVMSEKYASYSNVVKCNKYAAQLISHYVYKDATITNMIEAYIYKDFASSLSSAVFFKLKEIQSKEEVNVCDMIEYECLYETYRKSILHALKSCKKIARQEYQVDKLEDWILFLDNNYDYGKYIELCMKSAKGEEVNFKDIPYNNTVYSVNEGEILYVSNFECYCKKKDGSIYKLLMLDDKEIGGIELNGGEIHVLTNCNISQLTCKKGNIDALDDIELITDKIIIEGQCSFKNIKIVSKEKVEIKGATIKGDEKSKISTNEDIVLSNSNCLDNLVFAGNKFQCNGSCTFLERNVVESDIEQNGGTIIFQDATLNVKGCYIQKSGEININTGYVEINGDFSYAGTMKMQESNSILTVHGDFWAKGNSGILHSLYDGIESYITNGIIYIYGDFYQTNENVYCGFSAQKDNQVIFVGENVHKVNFADLSKKLSTLISSVMNANGFANLYVESGKLKLVNGIRCQKILCDLEMEGNELYIDINDIQGNVIINGDISNLLLGKINQYEIVINGDVVNLPKELKMGQGKIKIKGNLNVTSPLYVQKGRLDVTGNLKQSNEIYMKEKEGYIYVGGAYTTVNSYSYSDYGGNVNYYLEEGTIEIAGDFVIASKAYQAFWNGQNHKMVFSGTTTHTIRYARLESQRISNLYLKDGGRFSFPTGINVGVLRSDIVIEGDVKGNIKIQCWNSCCVKIVNSEDSIYNSATLIKNAIPENYVLDDNMIEDEKGNRMHEYYAYPYKLCKALANYTSDSVLEKGSEIILSSGEHTDIYYSTDGTMPTQLYTTPIVINNDVVIKVIVTKDNVLSSDILELNYTLKREETEDNIIPLPTITEMVSPTVTMAVPDKVTPPPSNSGNTQVSATPTVTVTVIDNITPQITLNIEAKVTKSTILENELLSVEELCIDENGDGAILSYLQDYNDVLRKNIPVPVIYILKNSEITEQMEIQDELPYNDELQSGQRYFSVGAFWKEEADGFGMIASCGKNRFYIFIDNAGHIIRTCQFAEDNTDYVTVGSLKNKGYILFDGKVIICRNGGYQELNIDFGKGYENVTNVFAVPSVINCQNGYIAIGISAQLNYSQCVQAIYIYDDNFKLIHRFTIEESCNEVQISYFEKSDAGFLIGIGYNVYDGEHYKFFSKMYRLNNEFVVTDEYSLCSKSSITEIVKISGGYVGRAHKNLYIFDKNFNFIECVENCVDDMVSKKIYSSVNDVVKFCYQIGETLYLGKLDLSDGIQQKGNNDINSFELNREIVDNYLVILENTIPVSEFEQLLHHGVCEWFGTKENCITQDTILKISTITGEYSKYLYFKIANENITKMPTVISTPKPTISLVPQNTVVPTKVTVLPSEPTMLEPTELTVTPIEKEVSQVTVLPLSPTVPEPTERNDATVIPTRTILPTELMPTELTVTPIEKDESKVTILPSNPTMPEPTERNDATTTPTSAIIPSKEGEMTITATILPTELTVTPIEKDESKVTVLPSNPTIPESTERNDATMTPTSAIIPSKEGEMTITAVPTDTVSQGEKMLATSTKIPTKLEANKKIQMKQGKTSLEYILGSGQKAELKSVKTSEKTFKVPDDIMFDGITYKVTKIGAGAFKKQKSLTKIILGDNITSIGQNAFYECSQCKTIIFGKNVVSIGSKAFYKCSSLTKLSVPKKVTRIEKHTFYGCSSLKSIIIGRNTTFIGDKAFYKCIKLSKITIPSKVKVIGKETFYGCKKLKYITIKTQKLTSKTVGSKAFKGIYARAIIKVPKNRVNSYKKLLKSKGLQSGVKIEK